jgi:hypothetical protein
MLGVSTLWRRASHGNREPGLSCRGGIDWVLEGQSMLSVDVHVARSNACIGTPLHSCWRGVGIGILWSICCRYLFCSLASIASGVRPQLDYCIQILTLSLARNRISPSCLPTGYRCLTRRTLMTFSEHSLALPVYLTLFLGSITFCLEYRHGEIFQTQVSLKSLFAHILDALWINTCNDDIRLQILPVRSNPLNSRQSHAGTGDQIKVRSPDAAAAPSGALWMAFQPLLSSPTIDKLGPVAHTPFPVTALNQRCHLPILLLDQLVPFKIVPHELCSWHSPTA